MSKLPEEYERINKALQNKDKAVEKRMNSLKSSSKFRSNSSLIIKYVVAVFTLIIGFTEFEEIEIISEENLKVLFPRAFSLLSAFLILTDSYLVNPNKLSERLSAASNALYSLLMDRGSIYASLNAEASKKALNNDGSLSEDKGLIEKLIDLDRDYGDLFGKINQAFKSKQPPENFQRLRMSIANNKPNDM